MTSRTVIEQVSVTDLPLQFETAASSCASFPALHGAQIVVSVWLMLLNGPHTERMAASTHARQDSFFGNAFVESSVFTDAVVKRIGSGFAAPAAFAAAVFVPLFFDPFFPLLEAMGSSSPWEGHGFAISLPPATSGRDSPSSKLS
jgi:hypothetical protein